MVFWGMAVWFVCLSVFVVLIWFWLASQFSREKQVSLCDTIESPAPTVSRRERENIPKEEQIGSSGKTKV